MKQGQLHEHATCSLCGNKIGHTGIPLFWTATVARHGIKLDAVRRHDGLAMVLGGNGYLAQVMGPDEEMTVQMMETVELTLCEDCAMKDPLTVRALELAFKEVAEEREECAQEAASDG